MNHERLCPLWQKLMITVPRQLIIHQKNSQYCRKQAEKKNTLFYLPKACMRHKDRNYIAVRKSLSNSLPRVTHTDLLVSSK